jgi:hypothetical protein
MAAPVDPLTAALLVLVAMGIAGLGVRWIDAQGRAGAAAGQGDPVARELARDPLWQELQRLRGEITAWQDRYYSERQATITQIVNLQSEITDLWDWVRSAETYMDASDALTGGKVAVPRPTRRKRGTGPLTPGPGLTGTLAARDKEALVGLLLDASWVTGSRAGRDGLLADLPADFRGAVARQDGARADLRAIIDLAADWATPVGTRSVLECFCDAAADALGETQPGQALRNWRARIAAPPG